MTFTPLPHQIVGANFLAGHEGGCLFDSPGLGKTLQAIMAADIAGYRRILVLCPAVVREHWADQFRQHQRIKRNIIALAGYPRSYATEDVVICSHTAASSDRGWKPMYAMGPWDALIVDEADAMANPASKRCQAIYGHWPMSLWKCAKSTWSLTGTPIVNSAADLWPIMASTLARRLGPTVPTYEEFCKRYTYIMGSNVDGTLKVTGVRNETELRAALAPHCLHRSSNLLQLPPLRVETFPVDVGDRKVAEILALAKGISPAKYFTADADGNPVVNLDDETFMRIWHAIGDAKAEATGLYAIEILRQGDGPIVIFFWHQSVLLKIMETVGKKGVTHAFIDGSNSGYSRTVVDKFQQGDIQILLVQMKAGGLGITLTKAHRALFAEQPLTSRDINQCVNRLYRLGQAKSVLAEVIYATGCELDQVCSNIVAKKARTVEKVLA